MALPRSRSGDQECARVIVASTGGDTTPPTPRERGSRRARELGVVPERRCAPPTRDTGGDGATSSSTPARWACREGRPERFWRCHYDDQDTRRGRRALSSAGFREPVSLQERGRIPLHAREGTRRRSRSARARRQTDRQVARRDLTSSQSQYRGPSSHVSRQGTGARSPCSLSSLAYQPS